MANHSLDFWLTSEDLPDPDNRVTLNRNGNIVLELPAEQSEGHEAPALKLKDADESHQTACRFTGLSAIRGCSAQPVPGDKHSAGRRGASERHHSVRQRSHDIRARRYCKAHELDNLYVVDGSFFPSSAAVIRR